MSHRAPRRDRSRAAAALLWLLLSGAGLGAAEPAAGEQAGPSAAPPPAAGAPLVEALRWLSAQGLDLVYSSALVRREMVLAATPASGEPRAILDEVLAAHDLMVVPGAGGRLVVVARPPGAGALRGEVRAHGGGGLGGVLVRVEGAGLSAITGAAGTFDLPRVPAGRHVLTAQRYGFATGRRVVAVRAGEATSLAVELFPAALLTAAIEVTASRFSILREEPSAGQTLGRREVERLPHLADDLYRLLALLPGTASGDVSAQLHVRGGATDETLVRLDGLTLYEPFHLEDFASIFSVIDAQAVGGVDFLTGGFPAEYGDRLSGVIDITTRSPERRHTSAGLSFVNARAAGEGLLAAGRGSWLASGRRGYLDLVLDLVAPEDDDFALSPTYYDLLAKVQLPLGGSSTLAVALLGAYDDLTFRGDDEEREHARARHDSTYAWANLFTQWHAELDARTLLAFGRIDRARRATADDLRGRTGCAACSLRTAWVRDARTVSFAELEQHWRLRAGRRHHLEAGLGLKALDASYRYASFSAILDPLQTGSQVPVVTTRELRPAPSGMSYQVYLADRIELVPSLLLELGLRWDRQTYAPGDQLSPRLNLLYLLGDRGALRAAWGWYHQSQGIHELQVEDGSSAFFPAQRAEHRLIGFESRSARGWSLRIEAYDKRLSRLRPRFESLHDPLNLIPEAAVDRVQVAPRGGRASGLEASLAGHRGERWSWRLGYALARAEDEVEGRWVPRPWDQRHALRMGLGYALSERWNVSVAGSYHSGWPTTPVTARLVDRGDGETVVQPALGRRGSARLPGFQRVDARLARRVALGGGSFTFFFEVMNLLDHRNVRGYSDFDFEPQGDGSLRVDREEQTWMPRIPSFGLSWSF